MHLSNVALGPLMLDTLFQNCAPDFSGQIINICIPLPEVVKNTFLVIQGTKSRPGIKAGVT